MAGTALWDEKLASMPSSYGVVRRALRRNVVSRRNWDMDASLLPADEDAAISYQMVYEALESIDVPVNVGFGHIVALYCRSFFYFLTPDSLRDSMHLLPKQRCGRTLGEFLTEERQRHRGSG